MSFNLSVLLLASLVSSSAAFTAPIFAHPATATKQRTAPSKNNGIEIEMPDFDELFGRIQQVSPLVQVAVEQSANEARGFAAMDDKSGLKWKLLEAKQKNVVHRVEKIDNFQNLDCPILRCRSSLEGPIAFDAFANLIMDTEERAKWDPAIERVYEIYPIQDLDMANVLMGYGKFGDCNKLGVGYCRTKKYLTLPGREQLTLCGIQDYPDGSMVIWGTEMEEWHNHLLPDTMSRTVRAKSHLFSVALVPTSENTFDVEYCLQIDVNFPNWVTTPMLSETIKGMFRHAKKLYGGDEIHQFIEDNHVEDKLLDRHSILMTP